MIKNNDVMQFTVYRKDTGKYVKNLDMPSKEDALLNVADDEILVEGFFDTNTQYDNGIIKPFHFKEEANYISKIDLVTKAALDELIPLTSIGSIMGGEFPSFFDISALSIKENIEYRIWWSQSDKLFYKDPKFKYCILNSKMNMKDLVN